jgi:hypothetical protein
MIEASNDAAFCRKLVNYRRYPIDDVDHAARRAAIGRCCRSLEKDGCAVIKKFLSKEGLRLLLQEAVERKPKTYISNSKTTNVYFSSDDFSLPRGHPRWVFLERSNGFITSDNFDEKCASRRLYRWAALTRFIADCLGKNRLYVYDDPISNMIVNVGKPGTCFNRHFDTNEFTITMLLKPTTSGGHFGYVPKLRSAEDECYADVSRVLNGDRSSVVRLELEPGDPQIFLGRFSLHRVTENSGDDDRLLLVMSYAEKPGKIGSVYRTRQLYGKVTETHLRAGRNRVRNDALMD